MNTNKLLRDIFFSLGLAILWFSVSQSHPADGYPPAEPSTMYGTQYFGYPEEYDFAEIQFTQYWPTVDELTDIEKYMIAGTTDGPNGGALNAWHNEVFHMIKDYDHFVGELPDEINETTLKMSFGLDPAAELDDDYDLWLEQLKSPITGEFPRLDALNHSAGNLYVRKLTLEEMQFLAGLSPNYNGVWFEGKWRSPANGEITDVKLTSNVYFIRVHGLERVIYEGIMYSFKEI